MKPTTMNDIAAYQNSVTPYETSVITYDAYQNQVYTQY